MKTALYLLLAFLFLAVSVISCSEEPKELIPTDTPSTENPTPTNPTIPVPEGVPAGAFVYLQVGTRWESAAENAAFKNWKTCAVSPSSPSTNIECEVTVPEAQLYRSAVEFKVGSLNPAYCPILSFRPYYYKRSDSYPVTTPTGPVDENGVPTDVTSGGYIPATAEANSNALSCGANTNVKECFGGAAPHLIEEFPKSTGKYFLTSVATSSSYILPSSNSVRYYGSFRVNFMVTNNLSAADRQNAVLGTVNERVADYFYDYEFECTSYWGERLFGITLTISDENWDSSGGADDYQDWN
ncbi:hypothetical protein [Bdellovibrio bacteriovorus]|uniref:hypothetical protein n=1 Tax=Bdellovibrio bacteriovorus TaxID=959 RepID=UPI0012FB7E6D|nr:hypothetical protein [Bdellovibrio bacteriovorus]